MVNLKDLLSLWGFTDHPFESYIAEKEARLTDYFVSPPYLDDVLGTAATAAPVIVFGSRGIGKSAIRIFIEDLCASGDRRDLLHGKVIAVTHDDFRATLRDGLDGVTLERHTETILRKMVCAALAHVAHTLDKEKPTKEKILAKFPTLDVDTFARLVADYYTTLSELQREIAFTGVYDYFKKESESISDRARWFMSVWSLLRIPILDIANLILAARGKDAIKPTPVVGAKNAAKKKEVILDDFRSLAMMTPQLGIDAWYVLIDKVDEDEATDNDASNAAQLVAPLLKNLRILEAPYIAFKFFLWDQTRAILVDEGVRFDKIRNFTMTWTPEELRAMIDKRLAAFSNGKVTSLKDIVEHDGTLYDTIIRHAASSPREIVQIVNSIFSEHARHSTQDTGAMITNDSLQRALDEYCVRRVKDMYPADKIRQLTRLPMATFTSSDVQAAFRIKQSVASRKITVWKEDGYIKQTTDVRSKKDSSKTVYQYEVSEPRLRRIIENNLMKDVEPDPDMQAEDEDE
jgi:hypothetical protein